MFITLFKAYYLRVSGMLVKMAAYLGDVCLSIEITVTENFTVKEHWNSWLVGKSVTVNRHGFNNSYSLPKYDPRCWAGPQETKFCQTVKSSMLLLMLLVFSLSVNMPKAVVAPWPHTTQSVPLACWTMVCAMDIRSIRTPKALKYYKAKLHLLLPQGL